MKEGSLIFVCHRFVHPLTNVLLLGTKFQYRFLSVVTIRLSVTTLGRGLYVVIAWFSQGENREGRNSIRFGLGCAKGVGIARDGLCENFQAARGHCSTARVHTHIHKDFLSSFFIIIFRTFLIRGVCEAGA